jgi:inward rectifier potassium channel
LASPILRYCGVAVAFALLTPSPTANTIGKKQGHAMIFKSRLDRCTRRIQIGGGTVLVHNLPRRITQDLYHQAMTITWPRFYAAIGIMFLAMNLLFALLFQLAPGGIANMYPANYWGAFFFSVETLATVGYGDMHPQTLYVHMVSTVEIFTGMMMIALITGVTFARFSLPRARIAVARNPLIRPVDGVTTLMLRAANARQSVIVDASATLSLLREEVSKEGTRIRRLYDLKLIRDHHPMFILSWSIMHVIDETSPLYGATAESLAAVDAGLILSLSGTDETTHQTMYHRELFTHEALRWNHIYADFLYADAEGNDHVDFGRLHEISEMKAATLAEIANT